MMSSSARAEPAPSMSTAVTRTSRRLCMRLERLERLACGIRFLVKALPSRLRTRLEWRRQDRRALLRLLLFLDLHLRNQNARRSRRDRNKARFRAAHTAKDSGLIVRRHDLAEGGKRRADQVDAPHQLFAPVRVDSIHHHGQYIKCVRDNAP